MPLKSRELGKYQRAYDLVSETDDTVESQEQIELVLAWVGEGISRSEIKPKSDRYRNFVERGLEHPKVGAKVPGAKVLAGAKEKSMLLDHLVPVLEDVIYAGQDILAARRRKSALTIILGICVGAAVGAALGVWVLPVVGVAVGGTVGAQIAMGLTAVGHGVGTGILGAFAGNWVGKKLSKTLFKQERYQLSKRFTNKLEKDLGIDPKCAKRINAYLFNRSKAVTSPLCKQYYKYLRVLAIEEADPKAMEKVAEFFCHELALLQQEQDLDQLHLQQRDAEIEGIKSILSGLSANEVKLSRKVKVKMEEAIRMDPDPAMLANMSQQVQAMGLPPSPQLLVEKSLLERDVDFLVQKAKQQAKEYAKQHLDVKLIINANGDDNIAIKLVANALKEGLVPHLDEEEYPQNNDVEIARVQNIMKLARQLAELSDPAPKKPRVRVDKS